MPPISYREATPTSSRSYDRYLASDFTRLTNRRLTAPASTPDFRIAHEPRAERPNKALSGVAISDKRAPKSFTPSTEKSFGISVNSAQEITSGQSSRGSSTGDHLETCVKEDNSGELPRCVTQLFGLLYYTSSYPHFTITYSLPNFTTLTHRYAVNRHCAVLFRVS